MKVIENILLLEYFVLIVCGLRMTHGQFSTKPHPIWGNQNDRGDQPDQITNTRSKRSLPECGVHGQKPTIDSLSAETTLPGEWPWLVKLRRSSDTALYFYCAASLIDNRFAITAAACIYSRSAQKQMDTKDIVVVVGIRDFSRKTYDEDNTRLLTAMYMHEEYNSEAGINNIALLVLKEPVIYSNLVKAACLWEGEDDQNNLEKAVQQGTVVGWGKIDTALKFDWVPQRATHRYNTSFISFSTCQEFNSSYANITNESFCAVTKAKETTCNGFRGSGLYIEQHGRWRLRGVFSGPLHGWCDNITVYTDVAKYRNWINDTTYRWSQPNILPVAARTKATGKNLTWTQQCSMRDEVNTLVTGGQRTREGEWPWHVAIYHNMHMGSSSSNLYKCGGSLISASHVLTVAHCLIDKLTNRPVAKRSINILVGTNNIKSLSVGVQLKLVDRLEIYPEYNSKTQYKDIAVLKLISPAEFTAAVRPVCLWSEDEVDLSNIVGKTGSVVGWGYDDYGLLAEELMLAELPVVSDLTCVRSNIFYYKYTNNFTFCAGLLRDMSVCNGDSGGGMVFKLRSGAGTEVWFLRGLVSLRPASDKPCDPSSYVIFTDVAKYLDWIKDVVSRDI